MADPVLGLGPNLNAYRAALQRPNQNQQMVHVARDVARTLGVAFSNIPLPVGNAPTRRERDILKLREAIEQMIQALSTAVKDGGFDGITWSDTSGQNFILPPDKTPLDRHGDQLELSVRSRQLMGGQESLEALERSLHPLENSDAARDIAWLAQAQVLHEAILSMNAQANIDPALAKRVLELSTGEEIREVLSKRAESLGLHIEMLAHESSVEEETES
jgi:hypothetical protein